MTDTAGALSAAGACCCETRLSPLIFHSAVVVGPSCWAPSLWLACSPFARPAYPIRIPHENSTQHAPQGCTSRNRLMLWVAAAGPSQSQCGRPRAVSTSGVVIIAYESDSISRAHPRPPYSQLDTRTNRVHPSNQKPHQKPHHQNVLPATLLLLPIGCSNSLRPNKYHES